ncbi:cytochrome P450 [Amycolatopsis regifaucium]|uniref:cytochrome P450 n=1 Tax=Amycolatopsis regifaucium TaxID=546365 RepID=UPI001FC9B829|nr:cytochrome P450 [Amycolatopsis regifaucium]
MTTAGTGLALPLDRTDTVKKLIAAPELFGAAVEEIVRYRSPHCVSRAVLGQ